MKQKLLTLLFMAFLPMAMMAYDVEVDGIYYNVKNTGIATVTYGSINYTGVVAIPRTFVYEGKTYTVTGIGEWAFSGCTGLTGVTIPSSVTSFEKRAFSGCSALKSFTIPEGVTGIDEEVFSGCSALTCVTINSNRIMSNTYTSSFNFRTIFGSQVSEYIIGEGVTTIGSYAFYNCSNLMYFTIPESVTAIRENAFKGCSGLTSVTINSNSFISKTFTSYNNLSTIFGRQVSEYIISEGVTGIGDYAFYNCDGLSSFTIPSSVTRIGSHAFHGCDGLSSITIPPNVTSIGSSAFQGCSGLTKVIVPDLVAWCGISFYNNYSNPLYYTHHLYSDTHTEITNLVIPEGVTSIGENAFYYCYGLKSLTIPEGVTSIGENAFFYCTGLTSLTIPSSVTSICKYTFQGCSGLKNVTIPEGVTSIGGWAFSGCTGLTSVTIPSSVSTIESAFTDCSNLTSVTINSNSFMSDTFTSSFNLGSKFGSQVSEYIIGEGVTTIGSYAFYNCSGLTSVTIPSSLTSIRENAFKGCSGLTSVTINSNSFMSKTFTSYNNLSTIFGRQVSEYNISEGVTRIGSYAFCNCDNLRSFTIPSSVTSIGSSAFKGCSGLTKVIVFDIAAWCGISFYGIDSNPLYYAHHLYGYEFTEITNLVIPEGVTSIGENAFYYCTGLKSVTIPESVTSIGEKAFSYCTGLTSLTIPSSVTSICKYTFQGCSGLKNVTIPEGVTSIGGWAFSGCTGLKSVTIPSSVTTIESAFTDCSNLTSVTINSNSFMSDTFTSSFNLGSKFGSQVSEYIIGEGVTTIGRYAFYNCSGLTSVTIPSSLTCICNYAFQGCDGLTKVIVPDIAAWCGIIFQSNPLYYAHHIFSDKYNEITNLVIPEGVTSIRSSAFQGCSDLTSVTISSSVTSIGSKAFSDCSNLTKVIVPNIAAWCGISFSNDESNPLYYVHHLYSDEYTEITNLAIPEDVTSIGDYVFSYCSSLTSVSIPEGVTSIGSEAFTGSSLTSVTIPSSVTNIGEKAFYECTCLSSVTISEGVTSIGSSAFKGCSGLTNVIIPSSVTSIGLGAFANCSSLTSVTIPEGVTSIDYGAFYGCSSLRKVTIPSSVTSIRNRAFYGCSGLTFVKVGMQSPLTIDSETFTILRKTTLYVPKGCKSAYQAAEYWSDFKNIKEFPDADVNQDGEIDMVDVVDIARFVVGTPAETFDEFLADLNSDYEVNVADAVVLVNEIVGDMNFIKPHGAPRQALGDDRLMLTENDDHSLSFSMENQRNYTAFQFDLYTNSEDDLMDLRLNNARKHGHQLIYNKVDEGHYRVVALSVANNTFNGNNGELLNIQLDGFNSADITISNIHFITTDGTDYSFNDLSLSSVTGIGSLTPNFSAKGDKNIYDLSGKKVSVSSDASVLPKGVYIVNGKKFIVK